MNSDNPMWIICEKFIICNFKRVFTTFSLYQYYWEMDDDATTVSTTYQSCSICDRIMIPHIDR